MNPDFTVMPFDPPSPDKAPAISPELRAQREDAARESEANLRLEGMTLTGEEKALQQRWIDGDITGDQWRAMIREKHSLSGAESA